MDKPTLQNYINGEWVETKSGKLGEQHNPADLTQVTSRFPRSTREEAQQAVAAAQAAYPAWAALPVGARAELLKKALAVLVRRREEIAQVITLENGKCVRESLGEIDSAIREMDWQIAEGRRMYGDVVPSDQEGVFAYSIRQPLGVVSVICPWNFPFNVASRKCTPALIAGNTVVMKPASLTPRTGACFIEAFAEAGLPAGVINLVTGDGGTVGDELVINPAIKAISFTGSTPVGRGIHELAAKTLVKTQMEMGGKNPAVVLADADLDKAADAVVLAAFACAGQWCTSTSRAIVKKSIAKAFQEKVLARVCKLKVGNGLDATTTMGPVCGEAQLHGVLNYIEIAKQEGGKILTGGMQVVDGDMGKGCFIAPTVVCGVTPAMTIAKEEVFGPVLAIIEVADFEEAVAVANDVEFGLSSSIFTDSLEKAMAFIERTDVGVTHVNMPTAFKEPQLSFGGIKYSGVGLPEAGKTGVEFFSRHKVVYIKSR
jgi:alpha-ketoglutaric semialdehyde dehydrogenase